MLAIVGGLAAALCWATSSMASARASRMVGSWATLGWVMLIGTIVTVPLTLVFGSGANLTPDAITLLVISGAANIVGLLFAYSAFRRGQVAVVAPILSTEGAMAAVIAVVFGEQIGIAAALVLTAVAAGVVLASSGGAGEPAVVEPGGLVAIPDATPPTGVRARLGSTGSALPFALAGVVCFGINLYASARIGATLPLVWSVMPARLGGFLFVAIPMLLTGRLRMTRAAAPLVVVIALAEITGTAAYAFGARDGIAIAAVMSSQFGAIAAIASVALFGERLERHQVAGIGIIAAGVATLAAHQAT